MKLNGWQRIGVVVSAIWCLGAGGVARLSETHGAGEIMSLTYRTCSDIQADRQNFDFSKCSVEGDKAFHAALENGWVAVLIVALIPIPFGWLLCYGLIRLVRWIRAGFRPKQASES
jgi:hypothetical protein